MKALAAGLARGLQVFVLDLKLLSLVAPLVCMLLPLVCNWYRRFHTLERFHKHEVVLIDLSDLLSPLLVVE